VTQPSAHKTETGQDRQADHHPAARFLFGWTSAPGAGRWLVFGIGLLSLILIAVDFIHHRHGEFRIEDLYGFYGLFGFAAFSFVVMMGWPLGKLLRRSEDYYDAEEPRDER
jgi:hypothetical protein